MEQNELDEVRDVLQYDPFNKAGDESADGEVAPEKEAAPQEEVVSDGGDTPEPEVSDEAEEEEGAQALDANAVLAQMTQHLERLANRKEESEPKAPKEPEIPAYDFQIPDQLQKMLDSDDPGERRQGYAYLMQGAARGVHQTLMNEMVQNISTAVPRMIAHAIEQDRTARATAEDFYGKYPELNKPELHQLVYTTAAVVAREQGHKTWGPKLRDETAKRVKSLLGVKPAAKTPAQKPGATGLKKGGGSPSREAPKVNEIEDLIFGGM